MSVRAEVARKRPAQVVAVGKRPARRGRSGQWVPALVFLALPVTFIAMIAYAFVTTR